MRRALHWMCMIWMLVLGPAVTRAYEASDDVNQKELTTQEIATAIRAQDVAQIEKIYDDALKNRTRFDDGAWHLTGFYEAFRRVVNEAVDETEMNDVEAVI